jgi:hypothetical protein
LFIFITTFLIIVTFYCELSIFYTYRLLKKRKSFVCNPHNVDEDKKEGKVYKTNVKKKLSHEVGTKSAGYKEAFFHSLHPLPLHLLSLSLSLSLCLSLSLSLSLSVYLSFHLCRLNGQSVYSSLYRSSILSTYIQKSLTELNGKCIVEENPYKKFYP